MSCKHTRRDREGRGHAVLRLARFWGFGIWLGLGFRFRVSCWVEEFGGWDLEFGVCGSSSGLRG